MRDRVVLVVVRDDGEHRAEDLLAGDAHGVVDVREQRGLHVPAAVDARRAWPLPPTTRRAPSSWPIAM